jgi:hypothetical protein
MSQEESSAVQVVAPYSREAALTSDKPTLQGGRVVCPKCGGKGVGYAPHAHAFGWKDYSRARCRYCKARFKVREYVTVGTSA